MFKDFPHSSHRVLLRMVGGVPGRILDAGAATGFLGRELRARGHVVVGVERDPGAAAAAAPHYAAMHVLDLQDLPRLPEAPFDVVVAGDVLEHLADPQTALRELAGQLAPGGRVLVCVPNVAFALVRLRLLAGRFDYADRGIMDATHLRFLTRRTLLRLIRGAGLSPVRVVGVPPPLPLLAAGFGRWPGRIVLELAAGAARVWPTLFAYQLVAEARA